MTYYVLLLFFPLRFAVAEQAPTPELDLEALRTFIRKMSDPVTPELAKHLKPVTGSNLTLSFDSQSSQGAERGILFGNSAKLTVAIPARGGVIEGVEDRDGELVNFRLTLDKHAKEGNHSLSVHPTSCKRCHGTSFTYIWREYENDALKNTWKGFLGEADDRVDPDDDKYMRLTSSPNFAPLFSEKPRSSFPYWQLQVVDKMAWEAEQKKMPFGRVHNGEKLTPPKGQYFSFAERKLENLPNARLGALLVARAARSVAHRAQISHPARYAKYKYSLLHFLLCGPYFANPDLKEEEKWAPLLADFERDMPVRAKQWKLAMDAYSKEGVSYWKEIEKNQGPVRRERILYPLMLLDYLGVAPESIMLTEPLPDDAPLSAPNKFITFLKRYRSESPLELESGLNKSLDRFIPAHLKDIDLKGFKASTELKANKYGYLVEEPLLKNLETKSDKPICDEIHTALTESLKIDLKLKPKPEVGGYHREADKK